MNPSHIELFGLPGSGKTTISRRLSQDCLDNTYTLSEGYKISVCSEIISGQISPVCSFLPIEFLEKLYTYSKAYDKRGILEKHRNFTAISERLLEEHTADKRRINKVNSWIQRLIVRQSVINENLKNGEYILYDEGFLQRLLSILCPPGGKERRVSPKDIDEYVSNMPEPDKIIIIDTSPKESLDRLETRGKGFPSWYEKDGMFKVLLRMESCIDSTVTILQEKKIDLLRVENDGGVDECCEEILSHLS